MVPWLPNMIMQRRWWIKLEFKMGRKYKRGRKFGYTDPHMVGRKVEAEIHNVIQMISCCYIHLPFNLSPAFSLVAISLSIWRRWWTSGWTATSEAERRGCWCSSTSLFSPVDAKVRGQERAHETRGWGSKFKRLSSQFQLRQWSAVDYWSPSMVAIQCLGAVLIICLLTTHHINILWEWNENEKKS